MDSPLTPVSNQKSEEGKTTAPELLETVQKVTDYVEILEEEPIQEETMDQKLIHAQETTSSYQNNEEINNSVQKGDIVNNQVPTTPGMTHKNSKQDG